jgi:CO/xanthine dehydrogenase Mo-binding subunit
VAATRTPTATVTLVRWTAGPRAGDTLDVDALAREAGLHPDLVRRFVDLGLLTPAGGTDGAPRFPRDAAALLACAARLRRDLGVGYAGAVLACELLARIDGLEARLRRYEPRGERPRR